MSNYQANIITKNPATPTGPAQNGSAPGMWRMDEVAYWAKQGVWPTQGIIPGDTYFRYVTMLLSTTSLGNANNSLFVDSSGAFNPVGRNGNTTQGSVTPYSANWSNYFDGSGDYLSLPSNAAFGFGTGDFTVECWVNPAVQGGHGSSNNDCIIDFRPGSNGAYGTLYIASSGASVNWFVNSANRITGSAIPNNTWTHLAVSRVSGNTRLFINGVQSGSTYSDSTNYATTNPWIAQFNDGVGSGWFQGYISNVRLVKGTGLYSSNFTPPTSALTAISGTSLLTCQSNRFRDASTNNFTITVNGNTRVTDFSPFAPAYPGITYNQSDITNWSGYFDGSGDYLTTPSNAAFDFGTGDFTIEGWVRLASTASVVTIVTNYAGPSAGWSLQYRSDIGGFRFGWGDPALLDYVASIPTNTWMHLAVTRSGTSLRMFLNGAQVASTTNSTSLTGGSTVSVGALNAGGYVQNYNGYISNLRIVKGTAVYTSAFTPSTSPLTAISGTSLLTLQNAAFTDNSTNKFVVTPNGNTTVTGNSPFNTVGYWSNYFDGSGDFLSFPSNTAFALGTDDFTIEAWIFSTDTSFMLFSSQTGGGVGFGYNIDNGSQGLWLGRVGQGPDATSGVQLTYNQWNHIAVTRQSNSVKFFVNGTQSGSTQTVTTNYGTSAQAFYIGRDLGTSFDFAGYASNARLVKGTAIYTSNFTVPTSPLTAVSGTSLLTCQNSRFIDNSTNNFTITVNGNTSVQSFDPFYTATIASNGGSMYFDNTGDYLAIPASPSLAFGTGNFTLEAWVYGAGAWSTDPIFESRSSGSSSTGYAFLVNSSGYLNVYTAGGFVGNSSTTLNVGSWNHVALVRSGTGTNQTTYYINGVASGTITLAGNFTDANTNETKIGGSTSAGENWNGYISDARISRFAVYTGAFTPPTAPLTPTANTTLLVNGMNAGLFDATAINDMETVSGAQVVTNISKFGGSSAFFNGTGGFLDIPAASSKDSAFGTGDFTVEMWLYFNSVSGSPTIITFNNFGSGDGFFLNVESSAIGVRADGSTPIRASTTVTTGVWYHVAVTRSSGTLRLFQDGVNVGSTTWTTNCTAGLLRIGQPKDTTGSTYALSGYMDELRVTKGYARYTSNFTPPTSAFLPY